MLLALREGYTTCSFCVVSCVCLDEHSIWCSMYKCVLIYNIVCTDGVTIYMCPCMLLVTYVATVLCVYMWILKSYR